MKYSEKELLYSAAVESSDDAILTKTLDNIITGWNPAAERLYGYTEAEAVGKHLDIIVPEERLKESNLTLQKIRGGKKVNHHETVRVNKEGNLIYVSLTVSPIKSASGVIIGASAIAREITERKQTEEFINQKKENLKYSDFPSSEIIWIIVNPENSADLLPLALNYKGKEDLFYEAVHSDDRETVRNFKRLISETQKPAEVEFRFFNARDELRWGAMIAVPATGMNNSIDGWLGIKTDITEQKQEINLTVSQLNKSYRQLRHLALRINSKVENVRQRIAIEVHDQLGGNLVEIKHNLERLLESLTTQFPKFQENENYERLENTKNLTVKTLEIVKKVVTELHPPELAHLGIVAAIRSEAESFFKRFGLLCESQLEVEEISLDKEQEIAVFRIFQELVRNIVRHAEATLIKITLTENDDEFCLTVKDNGRGISEKEKRAENSLGLLGIDERIQHVGGNFTIKGSADLGTIARICLPLKKTPGN